MVKAKKIRDRDFYSCGECGFAYETADWAKKCEDWCRSNHSCNLSIVRQAVNLKQ